MDYPADARPLGGLEQRPGVLDREVEGDPAMGVPHPVGVVEDACSLHRAAQPFGIREVQGGHLHPAAEGVLRIRAAGLWVDPNYRRGFARVATSMESTWRQRHNSLPSERWMARAATVGRETDPLTAMGLYQSLRKDMAYLEESILSAAEDLDIWIQQEIDRARGK